MTGEPTSTSKLFEVTNKTTGEQYYAVTDNPDDACQQAGWPVADCFVYEQTPRPRHEGNRKPQYYVKIPCQTCPYQYAECLKPEYTDCPIRQTDTDFNTWRKRALQAHLCNFTGHTLTKTDYQKGQKLVKLSVAITELTAKP